MRLWVQPSGTRAAAGVLKPPTPRTAPSSRDIRTCFFRAVFARLSAVWPGPATWTQRAAWGANRSGAPRAMCSGARSGSDRIRLQSDAGTLPASPISMYGSLASAALREPLGMAGRRTNPHQGILSEEMTDEREQLLELLKK